MKFNNNDNFESLQLIFEKTLNVSLLSEYIQTCRLTDNVSKVLKDMMEKDYDVYGVEGSTGKILGYIEKNDIFESEEGTVENYYKKFESEDLLSDSTSLLKLLEVLRDKNRMFVLENNTVEKIVTVADINKQPMRMLIFSFISLLEMQLTSIIKKSYPDNIWTDSISEERLKKAKKLNNERISKNEALSLLDSIQLCDKGTIIRKSEDLRTKSGLENKEDCKDFFNALEILRNNTAHSQDKIYTDNKELIKLVLKIKSVIETIQKDNRDILITS